MLNRQIVLHRFTVFEGNPLQQQFDFVCAAYFAPAFFGLLDQFERQPEECRARYAIAGAAGSVAHRGERRFDRVRRADVLPVLRREIVKRQQAVPVFFDFLHCLRILGTCSARQTLRTPRWPRRGWMPSRSPAYPPWREHAAISAAR